MQELVRQTLGAWRDAERLATECDPRSERYVVLLNSAAQLRVIYRYLTQNVVGQDELDTYVAVVASLAELVSGVSSGPGRVSASPV